MDAVQAFMPMAEALKRHGILVFVKPFPSNAPAMTLYLAVLAEDGPEGVIMGLTLNMDGTWELCEQAR